MGISKISHLRCDQGFPTLGCRPFSAEKEPLALSPGATNPWTFGPMEGNIFPGALNENK